MTQPTHLSPTPPLRVTRDPSRVAATPPAKAPAATPPPATPPRVTRDPSRVAAAPPAAVPNVVKAYLGINDYPSIEDCGEGVPSRAAAPPPQAPPRFVAGEFGDHAAIVGFWNADAATDAAVARATADAARAATYGEILRAMADAARAATDAAIQNLHTIADGVNLPENIKTVNDFSNFSLNKGQLKVTLHEVTYYVLAKQGGTYLLGTRKWPEVFDAQDSPGAKSIASPNPATQKTQLDLWAAYEGLIGLKRKIEGLTTLPQNDPTATSTKELVLATIDFLEKANLSKLGVGGEGLAVHHALLLAESLLSVAQPSPTLLSQISVALNALATSKPSVKETAKSIEWHTKAVLLLNAAVLCGIYELKPAPTNLSTRVLQIFGSKSPAPDELSKATTALENQYKLELGKPNTVGKPNTGGLFGTFFNSNSLMTPTKKPTWATVINEIVKITKSKLDAEVTEAAAEARAAVAKATCRSNGAAAEARAAATLQS